MKWLAHWLLVRGCNLLVPHAFFYSIRGPRIDERPPDVGPNSTWWPQYRPFAQATSRLCWLNTDSTHICELAILGSNDYLPWRAAKVCFRHQRDFNYLEARHLWEDAKVDGEGIHLAGMHYRALILEEDPPQKALPAIDTLAKSGADHPLEREAQRRGICRSDRQTDSAGRAGRAGGPGPPRAPCAQEAAWTTICYSTKVPASLR